MKTLEQRKKATVSDAAQKSFEKRAVQDKAERESIRSIINPAGNPPLRLSRKKKGDPSREHRQAVSAISFPDWLPAGVREEIKKRYQRGDFSLENLPQSLPEERKGIVQKFPGVKPFGRIYVWIGRSQFLNKTTGEPDISIQFYQELPEQESFWRSYLSNKGVSDIDFKVRTYTGYAIKANRYMREFLEQQLAVEIAKQKTLQAFDSDVKLIVATLLGSGL